MRELLSIISCQASSRRGAGGGATAGADALATGCGVAGRRPNRRLRKFTGGDR